MKTTASHNDNCFARKKDCYFVLDKSCQRGKAAKAPHLASSSRLPRLPLIKSTAMLHTSKVVIRKSKAPKLSVAQLFRLPIGSPPTIILKGISPRWRPALEKQNADQNLTSENQVKISCPQLSKGVLSQISLQQDDGSTENQTEEQSADIQYRESEKSLSSSSRTSKPRNCSRAQLLRQVFWQNKEQIIRFQHQALTHSADHFVTAELSAQTDLSSVFSFLQAEGQNILNKLVQNEGFTNKGVFGAWLFLDQKWKSITFIFNSSPSRVESAKLLTLAVQLSPSLASVPRIIESLTGCVTVEGSSSNLQLAQSKICKSARPVFSQGQKITRKVDQLVQDNYEIHFLGTNYNHFSFQSSNPLNLRFTSLRQNIVFVVIEGVHEVSSASLYQIGKQSKKQEQLFVLESRVCTIYMQIRQGLFALQVDGRLLNSRRVRFFSKEMVKLEDKL